MIKTTITDGKGKEFSAGVSKYNTLLVSQIIPPIPPVGTVSRYRYYNKLLGSEGAGEGITNQNVDGSIIGQTSYISAHPDYDLHIMGMIVIVASTIVAHNTFGNIAELANGCDLSIFENGEETKILDSVKTGGQMIAQSVFGHPYGNGATSFELTKWTGNHDAQTVVIPVHEFIPGGMRIGRGTLDRLQLTVFDDLTGLSEFTTRVVGYRHYP
jgi:hypothetical protein